MCPSESSCMRRQAGPLSALLAILAGALLGLLLRAAEVEEGGPLLLWVALPGQAFLRILSCLCLPLVLPKLVTALASMDPATGGALLLRLLAFYGLLNLAIECTALALFLAIDPVGAEVRATNLTQGSAIVPVRFAVKDVVFNLVPDNLFTTPFQRFQTSVAEEGGGYEGEVVAGANVLGMVAVAAAMGGAAALRREEGRAVVEVCAGLAALTSTLMDGVLRWACAPGLLSLAAAQVAAMPAPATALTQLAWFVLTMVAGNLVLPLLLLPAIFIAVTRSNPIPFYLAMSEALLVNFATASSISTYPVTLRCLTQKNGVPVGVASFALSLGVLINICSYPLLGLLYVAGLEGVALTPGQTVVAMLVLPVLAYGTSGIPQDSFLTVLLMCGMFGVPTAHLASLLAVDWLLDRLDGLCKVLTDATAVAVINHLAQGGAEGEVEEGGEKQEQVTHLTT